MGKSSVDDDVLRALHRRYFEGDESILDVALDAHITTSTLRRHWQRLGLASKPGARPRRSRASKPVNRIVNPGSAPVPAVKLDRTGHRRRRWK